MSESPDAGRRRWTVGELLAWTRERFEREGIDSPRVDAEHLLAHALGLTRMQLYVEHGRLLEPEDRGEFRDFVRRRLAREPVAYIEGTRGFHALDLDLQVDRRVLIPRPDTEHLVDWVLETLTPTGQSASSQAELDAPEATREAPRDRSSDEEIVYEPEPDWRAQVSDDEAQDEGQDDAESSSSTEPPSVGEAPHEVGRAWRLLDVGTGSGAIALALKRARPAARVWASDLDEGALAVASSNAQRNELELEFVRADLLEGLRPPAGGFDAIAANLPYIPSADLEGLAPEVRNFEPRRALDGGADGLDLVRRLVAQAAAAGVLAPGGWIFLEIGIGQGAATREILAEAGYTEISGRKDYGGIERVIRARR